MSARATQIEEALTWGTALIVKTVEQFDVAAKDEDPLEAYEALAVALGVGWRNTTVEALRFFDVDTVIHEVWQDFNKTRRPDELLNPLKPASDLWAVAEYVLDHVGEPIPYSTLKTCGRNFSGNDAAKVLCMLANENEGLVPEKTKLEDGKVGYLLRQGGDEPQRDWSPFSMVGAR